VTVAKGDTFTWNDCVAITVLRVARDQSWADIACQAYGDLGPGSVWTKRILLPVPADWTRGAVVFGDEEEEERPSGPAA